MRLFKIIFTIFVLIMMWLSAGCEKKPELKFSCYSGNFAGYDIYTPCATAEEERMSFVRETDRRLDRGYLPDGVSPNFTLTGYKIPTRGHVFLIRFLRDKEYKIERSGDTYTVTGPVWYKITPEYKDVCPNPNASLDSPCRGAQVMGGSDIRNGTLTFNGIPNPFTSRAQAQR